MTVLTYLISLYPGCDTEGCNRIPPLSPVLCFGLCFTTHERSISFSVLTYSSARFSSAFLSFSSWLESILRQFSVSFNWASSAQFKCSFNIFSLILHLYLSIFSQEGFTPLHVSSSLGNLDFVNFLINEGAKIDEVDAHGRWLGYVHFLIVLWHDSIMSLRVLKKLLAGSSSSKF